MSSCLFKGTFDKTVIQTRHANPNINIVITAKLHAHPLYAKKVSHFWSETSNTSKIKPADALRFFSAPVAVSILRVGFVSVTLNRFYILDFWFPVS